MNCKQAQHDIALWAGHDLDDASEKEAVRRHMTACPDCRNHYRRMKGTLGVLEKADPPATYVSGDSLWPELASRISHTKNRPSTRQNPNGLSGWMPMLAMTAACCVLLLVVNRQPQPQATGPIPKGTGIAVPSVMLTEGPPVRLPPSTSTNVDKPFDQRTAGDDVQRLEKQLENDQRKHGRGF
ncbi:MAG: zf-HC2 domain-containing protein [Planctomycetaceae bacterium]|nr:zf-HC2 domain-containing protein [Planctomycetaceae bacterium]